VFTRYNVSPIAVGLLVIYLVSFVLYRTKRIKVSTHRKIWNVLLLFTFLTTGIFGLILAIRRDYALIFRMPLNLLFWHVEAGVVMTIISLFHLSWHLSYYLDLLKAGREKQTGSGE
jgi:spermidine synthase